MTESESLIFELTHVIVPLQACRCLSSEERKILKLLEKVRDYLERHEDDLK